MTHEELLAKINKELEIAEFEDVCGDGGHPPTHRAIRAVVELHKPEDNWGGDVCSYCFDMAWDPSGFAENKQVYYPCKTIQAIEKELK